MKSRKGQETLMVKILLNLILDVVVMVLVVLLAAAATLAYGLRIGW
jgi:hypothetical protein